MNYTFKSLVFAIFATLSIFSVSSGGDKIIVIGVQNFEEYMPYSQFKNNEFSGFEREFLDLVAKKYGYTFEYKALPIKRLYDDFLNGSVDMKMPDNQYWSADLKKGKDIKYSHPILKYIDGVVVKQSNVTNGIDKFRNLGMILGFTPFAYQDLIKAGKVVTQENPNIEGLLKMVALGRVDGGYMNISVAKYYQKNVPENEKAVFNNNLPFTKSTRHISSIKYPEIVDKINEFLISDKVTLDELKARFKIEDGTE